MSRAEAGYEIRGSESKISRMELGRVSFKEHDLVDLLKLYGLDDPTEADRLITLAREANAAGWWHAYSDVLTSWFQNYLDLEQAAELIRTYEVQFVPGLLQTDAYARAGISLGAPAGAQQDTDRRTALRMARQQVLDRVDVSTAIWTSPLTAGISPRWCEGPGEAGHFGFRTWLTSP